MGGIRGLEAYLNDRRLLQTAPLSSLRDTRIGIDISHYLSLLLSRSPTKEPLVPALGGVPLGLGTQIENDLRCLEKERIKPVFVFPGLEPGAGANNSWGKVRNSNVSGGGGANSGSGGGGNSGGGGGGGGQIGMGLGMGAMVASKWEDDDARSRRRREAWDHYEKARVDQATSCFGMSDSVNERELLRLVHRIFKHRHVEFLAAPYLSWAQLIYLSHHPRAYVHSLFGSSSILLFPPPSSPPTPQAPNNPQLPHTTEPASPTHDKLIISINFTSPTPTITFVSKSALLADLGLNHEQFLDAGLLAGCELTPPFPGLQPNGPSSSSSGGSGGGQDTSSNIWRQAVEIVRQYRSGLSALSAWSDYPPISKSGYTDLFIRSRLSIKYSLVLVAEEGRVLPLPLTLPPPPPLPSLTAADIPSDIHEIFSHRLPDEVYFLYCRGLLSSTVLQALTGGNWRIGVPLCGGETEDWKRWEREFLTEGVASPRCVAVAAVANGLNPFWSRKNVTATYFWDPLREYQIPHSSAATLNMLEKVSMWNVDSRLIEEELRRQLSSTIDIALCLGATSAQPLAARTRTPKNKDKPLDKKDEIVANALWRFLELRSFLTSAHLHTPHARALHLALKESRVNDKFQEPLYLALELLRSGVLHSGKLSGKAWSGGPGNIGGEEEKRHMLLVMRVVSIVPLNFKAQAWRGPLSRELLVFNTFLRSLSRSLRQLTEAIVLNMLLRSDARRSRDDYLDVALSLPFQSDTNTGMGVLTKALIDSIVIMAGGLDSFRDDAGDELKERVRSSKEQAVGLLEGAFENVRNVRGEIERGFRFWDLLVGSVKNLRQDKAIDPGLADQFESAQAWLRPFRL